MIDRPGVNPRIDRMMVTGMSLSFVVDPPEAIVKIDNRVIGQAGTWNAKKRDGRAYDLPESGDHLVRILPRGPDDDDPGLGLAGGAVADAGLGRPARTERQGQEVPSPGRPPLISSVRPARPEAAALTASPLAASVRGFGGSGQVERLRLASGLDVCLIANRQAPIVTSVLLYRVGGRDEMPGASGSAHFLEHMMFKGSARFGPGEIDRRTQSLGGSNNAFTSHDLTAYYFSFSADRWHEALAIERDRMTALTLAAEEVTSERQVILEELAMYRDEPWDALELAVQAELFRGHPYGVPVLGTEADLASIDRDGLAGFHRRYYHPANALLVVAGDLGADTADAAERVTAAFGDLPRGTDRARARGRTRRSRRRAPHRAPARRGRADPARAAGSAVRAP